VKREEITGGVQQELPGLSRRIKARREELKWTQERLAEAAGVSREHVNRVEKGKNRTPHTVDKLALALGVHPLWLTTGLDCYAGRTGTESLPQYVSSASLAAAGNLEDDAPSLSGKLAGSTERDALVRTLIFVLGFVFGASVVGAVVAL
jgi:transcriptional regulator with XRE-family HTH domain